MKKSLFSIFVLLILSFMSTSVNSSMDLEYNKASRFFEEGWNLAYGFLSPAQIVSGEISQDNIKVVYGFIPQTQTYVRLYPNPDSNKLRQIDDDEIANTAFLIYSDKTGRINYDLPVGSYVSYQNRPLYAGWNFVGITPDMDGILDLESAGCIIQKAANFNDGDNKNWNVIDENVLANAGMSWNKINFIDNPDDAGNGILIKVFNNCKLGLEFPSPPSIPIENSDCIDSDGGLNYNLKGTVTGQNENGPVGITSASDECNGDNLYELVCKNSKEYYDESYICPYGCANGSFIQ